MLYVTDPPSLINITVMDTGTTFITISWISTSVGSVTYTITGDVMLSFTTTDTQYTINGLISDTSYRISVVPSVGMCQGEGKEVILNTSTCKLSFCSYTLVTYRFLLLNSSPLQLTSSHLQLNLSLLQ